MDTMTLPAMTIMSTTTVTPAINDPEDDSSSEGGGLDNAPAEGTLIKS